MEKRLTFRSASKPEVLAQFAENGLKDIEMSQSAIPMLARTPHLLARIETVLPQLPTHHSFHLISATDMGFLEPGSVHLVLTSPPYWTLKKYNENENQLGDIEEYDEFLDELTTVWQKCFDALVPGGRLICVVGDVCLSRRQNKGRHTVVPLHASIQERCREIGFDNLAPIIWHKIANANFEISGRAGFLGKPYEPNAVIKNDIEYILMQRKPGGYRSPGALERIFSVISEENHREWFNQIWTGLTGASTRNHPAPYPVELAKRLIRMFSFVGDTVLDPFLGSGTTSIAAAAAGRNSIGVEVDPQYYRDATRRFDESTGLNRMFYEVTHSPG